VLPRIRPTSRFIRVIDRTRMGNRQIWSLRSDAEESTVVIHGTVRTASDEPFSSPAKTPPLLLGRVLADRLARAGVSLKGQILHKPVPTRRFEDARILAVARTPLADVLARANKNSLNLAAECLLLRAGNGSWQDAAETAETLLARRYGIDTRQLTIRDGSGLSGKNRVSPAAMVQVLQSLADSPAAEIFLASLPISGTDGSLDDRLAKPPYRGRVRAKTGYIYGVCCLSGYVLDGRGKPAIAFSILVNDVPGGKAWVAKNLQDDLCRMLVDHLGG
jgi:D-alanyl-D-alanine carboxypeptidase/D-alanyl-D-alanine-endopeptidase (penicillin-binding protein 4)